MLKNKGYKIPSSVVLLLVDKRWDPAVSRDYGVSSWVAAHRSYTPSMEATPVFNESRLLDPFPFPCRAAPGLRSRIVYVDPVLEPSPFLPLPPVCRVTLWISSRMPDLAKLQTPST